MAKRALLIGSQSGGLRGVHGEEDLAELAQRLDGRP